MTSLTSVLLAGTAALVSPAQGAVHFFHADHVLGTSLDLAIVSASKQMAALALRAVQVEIARLDVILSGWRGDSELARLNASARHAASADLYNVIAAGEAWRRKSQGAFSLAAGFRGADLVLDTDTRTIHRPEGMRLAIDAIAKGYIVDRAFEAARRVPGIDGVMLDIGGDLRASGLAPDGKAWRVGVADPANLADNAPPLAMLVLTGGAVASSGPGLRGHAIIEPATGKHRDDILMSTAVAPTAMDADALSTIFHVLPPSEATALADRLAKERGSVAAHIVQRDGMVFASEGWARLAQNGPVRAGLAPAWPSGFSLKIDYEIPVIGGGRRVRVPYVTIWISNEAGEPVRTLAYYADKARFMRENYVFWERIGAANPGLVNAVTRPTRPPGAYSLTWDGRDDAGRTVSQGRYTVNIEASREHGGHNIQRIEIMLGADPATAGAPAQGEIGASRVTYGK